MFLIRIWLSITASISWGVAVSLHHDVLVLLNALGHIFDVLGLAELTSWIMREADVSLLVVLVGLNTDDCA